MGLCHSKLIASFAILKNGKEHLIMDAIKSRMGKSYICVFDIVEPETPLPDHINDSIFSEIPFVVLYSHIRKNASKSENRFHVAVYYSDNCVYTTLFDSLYNTVYQDKSKTKNGNEFTLLKESLKLCIEDLKLDIWWRAT